MTATSPQDTTDHVSGPVLSNVTWDTNFPLTIPLSIQELIGPRDRSPKESHIVTPALF